MDNEVISRSMTLLSTKKITPLSPRNRDSSHNDKHFSTLSSSRLDGAMQIPTKPLTGRVGVRGACSVPPLLKPTGIRC